MQSSSLSSPSPDDDQTNGPNASYSRRELHRNRRWNFVLTVLILAFVWSSYYCGVASIEQARVATALTLALASFYRMLFASSSSVKLDENSPGLGKKIHPRTMGGILGYLHDGFKR